MPKEIRSPDEFLQLAERASVCLIKRNLDNVKLKLRTPRTLYTFVTDADTSESLLKQIKCEQREI